jgi:hypothetical protein
LRRVSLPQLSDFGQLLLTVSSGKADLTFTEPADAAAFMKSNPGAVERLGSPVRVFPDSWIFRRGQLEFKNMINTGLDRLINSGGMARIIHKYEPSPNILYSVATPYRSSGYAQTQTQAQTQSHTPTQAPTQTQAEDFAFIYKLPLILQTKFIRLVSDKPIMKAQAQEVTSTVETAYDFDLDQLGWSKKGALAEPFTVSIVSRSWRDKNKLHFMGGTFARDLFCLSDDVFVEPVYMGVIAHELTHMLVIRSFNGAEARDYGWSALMGEGLALHNGKMFRLARQKDIYPQGRVPANSIDQDMTGADTQRMFSLTGEAAEGNALRYPVGQQFVEFLRVGLNGKGRSDAIRQLGVIVADMAITHRQFKDEFPEHFGTKLADAQIQFVRLIKQTEKHPDQRFAGTILMTKKPGSPDQ